MKIKYTFITGEIVEIEAETDQGGPLTDIEHDQSNRNRAETRRHTSIDALSAAGFEIIDRAPSPSAIYEHKETIAEHQAELAKLRGAIEELLPQQQDLVRKIYFENRTLTSIAVEEGVSVAAIQNRLKKILQRLKKILSQGV
jgi:RNA polymerase sigma factor (sigma-70 family)